MTVSLEPFDEAVYDTARLICTERAILGGAHAFDDAATFATAAGIRRRLADQRPDIGVTSAMVVGALRRLMKDGHVEKVTLVRRYKTRRPRPIRRAGYVVGEKL